MTETTALPHEANHSSTAVEPRLTWFERFVAWNWSNRRGREGRKETEPRAEYWRQRFIMATGVGGEGGEILELLKKHARDGHLDEHQLGLEIGDQLVYLTRLAQEHGLSLELCMRLVVGKLKRRNAMGKDAEGEASRHELLAWCHREDAPGEGPTPAALRRVVGMHPNGALEVLEILHAEPTPVGLNVTVALPSRGS